MVQLASEAVAPTRAGRLIILDRDGVINHDSDLFIKTPDEWRPIPGSLEAIARLNHAGYRVVVATNQSGVGRGLLDITTLNAIHERMHRSLAQVGGRVDAIFFCPHSADSQCECRKPRPGMLLEIGRRFGVEMNGGLGEWRQVTLTGTSHYIAPAIAWNLANGVTFKFSPSFGVNSNSNRALVRFGVSYEIPLLSR